LGKVYAVGVGPGSPKYVTEIVKEIILNCDIVVGYKYTLKTIENLIEGKEIYEITMKDQEEYYQKIVSKLGDRILVIPFTGDVNFSESEVVDRLIEIFGEVEIIPGISSIQVAASRAQVPLDKSKVMPWPNQPNKHFMASEIAVYLREHGFDTAKIKVHVFEAITTENETSFVGTVKDLEGKEFSDLSIIVFNQTSLDSYMNYRWQWKN